MADSNQIFDPYTQTFTLYQADGTTSFQISVADLDQFNLYNTRISINYASQLGASIIMLVVVLLVTRDSKRRSPLFVLNILSLVLSILRSLLQLLYWVGPFTEVYEYFSNDFSAVPRSAYANSIASIVMTFLFLCTIELSLVIQTRVICATLRSEYRLGVTMMSTITALLTIGLRFANMVQNAEAIMTLEGSSYLAWLASAALIMETISIWYYCVIFVGKLGVTLYQRRRLGLKQWGPMQIICIMGGCTMIIPSIFAILEYFPDTTFPEAGSLALTLVAIFLPLSSIWAAAAIDGTSPTSFNPDSHRKLSHNSYSAGYTNSNGFGSRIVSTDRKTSSIGSLIDPALVLATVEHCPMTTRGPAPMGRNKSSTIESDDDLDDIEFMGTGVRIDKTYSVHTGKAHGGVGRN